MSRARWAQLVLAAAALFGVQWVYPRLSRTAVRFEVRIPPCVTSASIEIYRDGDRLRGLQITPSAGDTVASYATALHKGDYQAIVRLDCVSGDVHDGKPRPVVITDEATIYLRSPGTCLCHE